MTMEGVVPRRTPEGLDDEVVEKAEDDEWYDGTQHVVTPRADDGKVLVAPQRRQLNHHQHNKNNKQKWGNYSTAD